MQTPPASNTMATADVFAAGRASRLEDREFALMLHAYEQAGGIRDGDHLGRLMRPHWNQPISQLARWIVDRRIVNFNYRGATWIPMFQFEPDSMYLEPSVARVIDELTPAFDDWELAVWFASPNEDLQGQAPVDVIEADAQAVLAAARVDRFISRG